MKHARDDYNRIQDPAGLIPEDEPVFLLRAQDKHAAETVIYYAKLIYAAGGSDDVMRATLKQANAMAAWPKHKAPDMPAHSPQVSATEADRG